MCREIKEWKPGFNNYVVEHADHVHQWHKVRCAETMDEAELIMVVAESLTNYGVRIKNAYTGEVLKASTVEYRDLCKVYIVMDEPDIDDMERDYNANMKGGD